MLFILIITRTSSNKGYLRTITSTSLTSSRPSQVMPVIKINRRREIPQNLRILPTLMMPNKTKGMMEVTITGMLPNIHRSSKAPAKDHKGKHKTTTSICSNNLIFWIKGDRIQLIAAFSSWTSNTQAIWRICSRSNQIRWYCKIYRTYRTIAI